jgi:ribosome-associated protein
MTVYDTDTLSRLDVHARATGSLPFNILPVVVDALSDGKAQDITTISLIGKASFGDYMVLASGTSQRHLDSLAERVEERLQALGKSDIRIEGKGTSEWVLVDAGDVIVHLFRPEARHFYHLEKMWEMEVVP